MRKKGRHLRAAVADEGSEQRETGASSCRSLPPGIDDAALVGSALAGDRRAEDALYRRYARTITALVGRLLGRSHEVEDVVHDTFVAAFEKLQRLRDAGAFAGWLRKIAVTMVRKRIRRRQLRRRLGWVPFPPDLTLESMVSKEAGPDVRAALAEIDAVLETLPSTKRLAWMLRIVEGHSLPDVASLCGCSLATAKRHVAYVQEHLSRSCARGVGLGVAEAVGLDSGVLVGDALEGGALEGGALEGGALGQGVPEPGDSCGGGHG